MCLQINELIMTFCSLLGRKATVDGLLVKSTHIAVEKIHQSNNNNKTKKPSIPSNKTEQNLWIVLDQLKTSYNGIILFSCQAVSLGVWIKIM